MRMEVALDRTLEGQCVLEQANVLRRADPADGNKKCSKVVPGPWSGVACEIEDNLAECSPLGFDNGHGESELKRENWPDSSFGNKRNWVPSAVSESVGGSPTFLDTQISQRG